MFLLIVSVYCLILFSSCLMGFTSTFMYINHSYFLHFHSHVYKNAILENAETQKEEINIRLKQCNTRKPLSTTLAYGSGVVFFIILIKAFDWSKTCLLRQVHNRERAFMWLFGFFVTIHYALP